MFIPQPETESAKIPDSAAVDIASLGLGLSRHRRSYCSIYDAIRATLGAVNHQHLWARFSNRFFSFCFRGIEFRTGKVRKEGIVQDYLSQVEELRKEAAECALIRDSATYQAKHQAFDRLANHLNLLGDQVEAAMLAAPRFG